MSVKIDRGVFALWEQRFAEFDEPGITLRLRSAAPEEGLLRVLRRVTLRVERREARVLIVTGWLMSVGRGRGVRCGRPMGCLEASAQRSGLRLGWRLDELCVLG
jgi:hypothetical protein